ncbi:MAG TPA: 4-hydroxy-tetrahydrodipicolinate reductase [Rhodanobacteraceae bacterium]|nr:4-hydroxy-tetrahydrodipicolinate reductase [Rhodanobacteraceae bacterium]
MTHPLRLAINGAQGRMGRLLCAQAAADAHFELLAECQASTRWQTLPALDVVVDFSSPDGLTAALDHCLAHGVALVSGTTGLTAELAARLDAASAQIPILRAANFSLGIAVLTRVLRDAAAALPDWDIEILEAHHAAKRDAPSGTALALGESAAAARGITLNGPTNLDRNGLRVAGSIGFASLRAGDIVGEHMAMLATAGERLELGHRATDRGIFARGALHAARWLAGRAPGLYSLADMLETNATSVKTSRSC